MEVTVTPLKGIYILKPSAANLDLEDSKRLLSTLTAEIAKGGKFFIIDLTDIETLDISVVGTLITAVKLLESPKSICLCANTAPVLNILNLSRIGKLIALYDSLHDAIVFFDSKAREQ